MASPLAFAFDVAAGITSRRTAALATPIVTARVFQEVYDMMRPEYLIGRNVRVLALAMALLACTPPTESAEPLVPPPVLSPACGSPAPLEGIWSAAAPRYIVVLQDTIDVRTEVDRLAELYGFEPRHVWEHVLRGFSAELTPEALANLRCEPSISYVRHVGPPFMLE
jgi:hypothetical protein